MVSIGPLRVIIDDNRTHEFQQCVIFNCQHSNFSNPDQRTLLNERWLMNAGKRTLINEC